MIRFITYLCLLVCSLWWVRVCALDTTPEASNAPSPISEQAGRSAKYYRPSQFRLSYAEEKNALYLTYHLRETKIDPKLLLCQYAEIDAPILATFKSEKSSSGISEETKTAISALNWREAKVDRHQSYHESAGTEASFKFTNLKPNTDYIYVCAMSDFYTFNTGDYEMQHPDKSSKMLWIGDMGALDVARDVFIQLLRRAREETIDSVVLVGDISYADNFNCSLYEVVYESYLNDMTPIMSKFPFMVVPGNHEHAARFLPCKNWAKDFITYNSRFRMPQVTKKFHNMWYSYDWRHVHIVGISTETDYPKAPYSATFGDQLKWLEEDLKKAQARRKEVPWIIVMGHRPIYSSHVEYSEHGKPVNSSKNVQDAFEDLLYKYNVDMYICGHVHSYERTHPVYKSVVTKDGPIHIVNGHAGNPEGRTLESSYANPPPSWSAFHYTADYGYAIMETTKNSLEWSMFAAETDSLVDHIVLHR